MADALALGIFGKAVKVWFVDMIMWGRDLTEEDYQSPPWVAVH